MNYYCPGVKNKLEHYEKTLLVCSSYYYYYALSQLLEWYKYDVQYQIGVCKENEQK